VSDVEPDLRTLLREKADEVRPDARIPSPVLRRSRRRRVVTGLLAGALTVGVVAGVFVGARVLIEETAPEPREVRPAGTPTEFYPFIYPPTQAELDTTVAEVAQGSMPLWTEPEGAAALFAVNVMGWDPNDVEASVRGDDPLSVVITNPSLNEAVGATADLRTVIYLAPVPGSGEQPVYAVLAAQAEDVELEPVGPDDQVGANGRLALRGSLWLIPEGANIELRVGKGTPVSEEAPEGVFYVAAELPDPPGPSTLISLAVKDRAGNIVQLTSSRLATPLAGGGQGGTSELEPALPSPVARTRDAILAATQARDFEALRALIPEEGFTFSFGGDRDPIAYWKRLESQAHVPVIGDILPMVLGTVPVRQQGTYIWPAPAAKDPADWDEGDLEVLRLLHPEEDIRLFQEAGLYTGWRAGIDRDGTWVFFVSGD
jgi:hypothetical protein